MPVTATPMTEADLRPAVEELLDEIVNGDDTHWQEYASAMSAQVAAGFKIGLFKCWSSNNRFYLAAQAKKRHTAVHGMYAGVDQWRKRGREVRDGEQPFVIFGPPSFIIRNPNQQQQQQNAAAGQQGNQPAAAQQNGQQQVAAQVAAAAPIRGYRRPPVIEVFDYSQTVSTDPDYIEPDWSVPLAGGDLGTLHRLTQVSPVPVTFTDLGSKLEHGWLDDTGITVDSSRTPAEQIFTLAHELGHYHLGHLDRIKSTRGPGSKDWKEPDVRATCEQEAAMVQFLVMKMLGLDESVGIEVTAAAGQYLRSWIKTNDDGTTTPIAGHKGRRKLLKARFDVALRAAQTIVSAYVQLDDDAQAA